MDCAFKSPNGLCVFIYECEILQMTKPGKEHNIHKCQKNTNIYMSELEVTLSSSCKCFHVFSFFNKSHTCMCVYIYTHIHTLFFFFFFFTKAAERGAGVRGGRGCWLLLQPVCETLPGCKDEESLESFASVYWEAAPLNPPKHQKLP